MGSIHRANYYFDYKVYDNKSDRERILEEKLYLTYEEREELTKLQNKRKKENEN